MKSGCNGRILARDRAQIPATARRTMQGSSSALGAIMPTTFRTFQPRLLVGLLLAGCIVGSGWYRATGYAMTVRDYVLKEAIALHAISL
jgi:hypothetical protein